MSLFRQQLVSLFNTKVEKKRKAHNHRSVADEAINTALEPWEVEFDTKFELDPDAFVEKRGDEVTDINHHHKVQSWLNKCPDTESARSRK